MSLDFIDWGLIDYEEALQRQLLLLEEVSDELRNDTIVFCQHPPVVTLGKATLPGDVFGWTGPTVEVSRGGRATYHGPSQVIIYPLVNMNRKNKRDIFDFLRTFEKAIVKSLNHFGIQAEGRSLQVKKEDVSPKEETGVWVHHRKIASLGIGVKKWTTYHGASINVDYDPQAFFGIKPCGFDSNRMISMEELTQKKIEHGLLKEILKSELSVVFENYRHISL